MKLLALRDKVRGDSCLVLLLVSRFFMCGPEGRVLPDGKSSGTYMFAGIGSIFVYLCRIYVSQSVLRCYNSAANPLERPTNRLTVNPSNHNNIIASIS